jgi:hypothetical protein
MDWNELVNFSDTVPLKERHDTALWKLQQDLGHNWGGDETLNVGNTKQSKIYTRGVDESDIHNKLKMGNWVRKNSTTDNINQNADEYYHPSHPRSSVVHNKDSGILSVLSDENHSNVE